MNETRIEIALDTCAILHHRAKLADLARQNPNIHFVISTVVIGEVFQHPTDDFHDFANLVGKDRWQLGSDWFAKLLSTDTRQLIREDQLSASRKDWSFSQRFKVWRFTNEMRRYKKRYENFRSKRRRMLRVKLTKIAEERNLDPNTKWFSELEKTLIDWNVNIQDSLFALEITFPKTKFDRTNSVVALSGFLMFGRLAGVLMDTKDAKESNVGNLRTSPLYPFFGSNEKRVNFFDVRIASEAMGRKYFATSDSNLIAALKLAETKKLIDFKLLDLNEPNAVIK